MHRARRFAAAATTGAGLGCGSFLCCSHPFVSPVLPIAHADASVDTQAAVPLVRSVLLVIAMEQEAAPIISHFALKQLKHQFLPGSPMVAWQGLIGRDLTLRLVWSGRDARYNVNNVGTAAAAVATYAAVSAFGVPDLVLSVGTAGGFAERGAKIGDVYLSTKCVFHDRRIPEGGSNEGELEEYGFGHYRSPPLAGLAAAAGLKSGVISTSDSLDHDGRDMELMLSEGAVVKEMEAASVAWVCKQLGLPFAALKAVTDIVDGPKATREEFESNLGEAALALQVSTLPDILATGLYSR